MSASVNQCRTSELLLRVILAVWLIPSLLPLREDRHVPRHQVRENFLGMYPPTSSPNAHYSEQKKNMESLPSIDYVSSFRTPPSIFPLEGQPDPTRGDGLNERISLKSTF